MVWGLLAGVTTGASSGRLIPYPSETSRFRLDLTSGSVGRRLIGYLKYLRLTQWRSGLTLMLEVLERHVPERWRSLREGREIVGAWCCKA